MDRKDTKQFTIYMIKNKITGEMYIGQTTKSIEQRWAIHCHDAQSPNKASRPLYDAINYYGHDNFTIEEIEVVNGKDNANERERHWIEQYRTFTGFNDCRGYNDTLGGAGKAYIDKDTEKKIIEEYQREQNVHKICEKLEIDRGTATKILERYGFEIKSTQDVNKEKSSKRVRGFTKDGKCIGEFSSTREAAEYLTKDIYKKPYTPEEHKKINNIAANITRVCNGKRQSVCQHTFEYVNKEHNVEQQNTNSLADDVLGENPPLYSITSSTDNRNQER